VEIAMSRQGLTPYFDSLKGRVAELGGLLNAHLHLDRSGTYEETFRLLRERGVRDGAALTLAGKHAVIPMVHASEMYHPRVLRERVSFYLDRMEEVGTTRADTLVDVTDDEVGLRAIETLRGLKGDYAGRVDLRLAAYSPLGYRDDQPRRWDLLEQAARGADFIGLLPERDDRADYPDHIGFRESCERAIRLAFDLDKPIHIHVDQANHEYESGSETVVDVVERLGLGGPEGCEPRVWLIHMISPSTYPEERFRELVDRMAEWNIGVITCPSAAISMRQCRPLRSPTFNAIARVLELLAAGIWVRVGSDNICDITSPMGTPDLFDELFVLANAIRFYDLEILAKLGTGLPLDQEEIVRVRSHLAEDHEKVTTLTARWIARGSKSVGDHGQRYVLPFRRVA
jgi:cytosine/adenosine deaminase-related metal-dependent hydrolase